MDAFAAEILEFHVPRDAEVQRLDTFLVAHLPQYSRTRIAEMINSGFVLVNGRPCRPSRKLRGGEQITVRLPPEVSTVLVPVPMELQVLFADEHLVVIDKPAGIVVHPGAGTTQPTLVQGLLYMFPELTQLDDQERPGIVHRLDKDTSGCLVVARSEQARRAMMQLFAARLVQKQYYALVKGVPCQSELALETTIGRSVRYRSRMTVNAPHGRVAYTRASVVETFGTLASALAVRILTGRTHQIRVHLAYVGCPVLGDAMYGRAARELSRAVGAARQMLHAHRLTFPHPITGKEVSVTSPIPPDITAVVARLRARAGEVADTPCK
ncbi:MAG: RluA family pseudouridine synthase [bacterium]|nr:RluA family pseudouridine synthase [bacterium]